MDLFKNSDKDDSLLAIELQYLLLQLFLFCLTLLALFTHVLLFT